MREEQKENWKYKEEEEYLEIAQEGTAGQDGGPQGIAGVIQEAKQGWRMC